MSVSSILTSIENEVSILLGSGWKELNYIYDLENNSFKGNDKRYGVGATSGTSVTGTTKAITVDFEFFVTLTRSYVNRYNDTKEREVLSDLYDKFDVINKNVFQKKLNNANVLLVSEISYNAPEQIDKATLALTVDFTVKFRNQTT